MQNGILPTKWDNANEGKEKLHKIWINMTRRDALFDLGKSYAFFCVSVNAPPSIGYASTLRVNVQVGGHFRLIDEDYALKSECIQNESLAKDGIHLRTFFEVQVNKVCSFSETTFETGTIKVIL